MPYMIRGDWVNSAFAERPVTSGGETHLFTVHELGNLHLPSGRVAASDPFVHPAPDPFDVSVQPGTYPVDVAVSELPGPDQRVAFARLTFGPAAAHRWSMATVGSQDPESLGPDGIFGYPVDAGTGCFISPEASALLDQRMSAQADYFEDMIAAMQKTYRHTWSWARLTPNPSRSENLIAFSSGLGDGVYATYVGFNQHDKPICLVTDFGVISDPDSHEHLPSHNPVAPMDARPWWKFWSRH